MNDQQLLELTDSRIKQTFSPNFRSIIFGSSGSGKSFFLTQKLFPKIQEQYDFIVVFTRPTNYEYYIRQTYDTYANRPLPPPKQSWFSFNPEPQPVTNFVYVSTDPNEFTTIIDSMPEYQQDNIKSIDDEGNPVYKYRGLFIFDDVLDERFSKSQSIINVFTHYRHYNIDTFFLVQTSAVQITPLMRNNIDIFIMTKMKLAEMRNRCLNYYLKDIIQTIDMKGDEAKQISQNIYKKVCEDNKHGVLLLDMNTPAIYYTTSTIQPREVKGYKPPSLEPPPKTYTDSLREWWYGPEDDNN